MLGRTQQVLAKAHVLVCGGWVLLCYYVLYRVWSAHSSRLQAFDFYRKDVLIFTLLVMASLYTRRVAVFQVLSTWAILQQLLICFVVGVAGYAVVEWLFKFPPSSRLFLLSGMGSSYVVVSCWLWVAFWRGRAKPNNDATNALLVGDAASIGQFVGALARGKTKGLRIVGAVSVDRNPYDATDTNNVASIDDIDDLLDKNPVDCAIFLTYRQAPQLVEHAVLRCRERGVEVWLRPDFMQLEASMWHVDHLHGIPLLVFSLGPQYGLTIITKRAIDLVGSTVLLLLIGIPLLITALIVRLTSKGSAFFRQPRVGINGRTFMMYKLRSMHADQSTIVKDSPLENEMTGPVFKMKNDPRVTPLGRWLRKYSIDELPQLWNVLIGDMSLVGPRPPLRSEVDKYTAWQRRRLTMRPGITGLWQVTGRNEITDFDDWAASDLWYIDNWSLALDMSLLVRTIPVVFGGTGY